MKRLGIALTAALLSSGTPLLADDEARQPEQLFKQLDKNSDGILGKDEVPQEQMRFFERLVRVGDKNDDGKLSQDEFTAGMKAAEPQADARPTEGGRPGFGGGRPPFDAEMFERADANKDGKVTREELPEQVRERLAPMFERLGKEEITLEDVKRMQERFAGGPGGRPGEGRPGMGRPNPEMLARLRSMDANKDGRVTLEEVPEDGKARVEEMLQRMGRDAIDLEQLERMIAEGGPRPEGDRPRPEGRDGDRPRPEGQGDRPRPEGDRPRPEGREGDRPRPEGPDGDRPRPDGERPPMPRDGERPPMPRDGERPPMPRDGERPPFGGPDGAPRFVPPILGVLDSNKDGRLSPDELEEIEDKFEELDRNHDGQLDRAELLGFPPGGPGMMRDGEGGPRGFGPRDGEGPPRGEFGPRDGEGPPRGEFGPRDGEGRPEGFRPPRDGEGRSPEGFRPPRDGEDRPQPRRPEAEDDDRRDDDKRDNDDKA